MTSRTFPYVSATRAEGRAEGRAEEAANIVLRLLSRRGIHVDEPARERITSCTDLATLEKWTDRTLDITAIEQLFED